MMLRGATIKETVDYRIKYQWQQFVVDAFLEFRREHVQGRVDMAERAIGQRLSEALDLEEQLALRDALSALRVLIPQKAREEDLGHKKNIA